MNSHPACSGTARRGWAKWVGTSRLRGRDVAGLLCLLASSPAAAEPEPESDAEELHETEYSSLEEYTVERELKALRRAGEPAEVDLAPEGKRIESVRVVALEVFDEQDPVPKILNRLHVTTRSYVIERELLLKPGDVFRQESVRESERNLRLARQLSLVLIVPLVGSKPGHVRVLVIARDVWSLRMNWNARFQAGKLEQLLLQPSEENLFGTHRTISGLFALQLDRYILGAAYINPRVGGSRIQGSALANVIFNRESGDAEGSYGGFFYGQPLYSTQSEWAWGTTVVWRREVVRRFVGGELGSFETDFGSIPYEYESDKLAGEYALVRSFGRRDKFDLSVGAEATRRAFGVSEGTDPRAAAQFFEQAVPQADTRVSPFVGIEAYSTRYLRTLDLETLGLQEDVQLGHRALLKLYPASSSVGSSRDLLGVYSAVGYTQGMGDGMVRVLGASRIEMAAHAQSDAEVEVNLRVATPRFGIGRLVYDGLVGNRFLDYLNDRYGLGGQTRPRGYPSFAFIGKDRVASSLELRTRSVRLLGAELGSVLFYDAADAFNGFDRLRLNHGVGVGLRGLLPMFDRTVFRLDWGFPVGNPDHPTFPGNFVVTFAQAFLPPQTLAPRVTTGLSEAE